MVIQEELQDHSRILRAFLAGHGDQCMEFDRKSSSKPRKWLFDVAIVPAMNDPFESCIVVTSAGKEVALFTAGRGSAMDLT